LLEGAEGERDVEGLPLGVLVGWRRHGVCAQVERDRGRVLGRTLARRVGVPLWPCAAAAARDRAAAAAAAAAGRWRCRRCCSFGLPGRALGSSTTTPGRWGLTYCWPRGTCRFRLSALPLIARAARRPTVLVLLP